MPRFVKLPVRKGEGYFYVNPEQVNSIHLDPDTEHSPEGASTLICLVGKVYVCTALGIEETVKLLSK